MAAQAARALNAVKAAQAEQAAAERASHKLVDAAENLRLAETLASESAQTEAGRSRGEALAATPPVPEAGETSGAADSVVAFTLSESPAPVEADAEERPVPAPVHERPERGAPGAALAVLPRHELIAAAPIPRRSRLRPMLLVGLVVVVGLLAYRHWDIGQDATPATAPATAELRTGQGGEVPASVPVPPVLGTASPAPSRLPAKPLPATPVLPAGPGAEPEQTGEAAVAVSRENANPPRQDLMPAVAAPAPQTQTARSENAETRPKAPEVAASTESSPRQAGAPPPRYGPPGYGYYPPPGSWPRYYGPGYRQPPSR
jgi:hypothetical protein